MREEAVQTTGKGAQVSTTVLRRPSRYVVRSCWMWIRTLVAYANLQQYLRKNGQSHLTCGQFARIHKGGRGGENQVKLLFKDFYKYLLET